MLRVIPKHMYKDVEIGDVRVCGYKSEVMDYSDGLNNPKSDHRHVSLSITTSSGSAYCADFKFTVYGRENLEKMKEAIDFALEIIEEPDKDEENG